MNRNDLFFALKTSVASAALLALAVPLASPADAGGIKSGRSSDKASLTISGQVSRAVSFVDDGENAEILHVDNDNSSTRVRFVGKGQVTDDFSVGTLIEVDYESSNSPTVNQNNGETTSPTGFSERHMTVYLDSKKLGRLWIGQGDTASNGTSEVDLSGTAIVVYSGVTDMAGGVLFQDENNGHAYTNKIGSSYSNNDGLSRNDRIRYDTPTLAGFKASVSHIGGGSADAALRYSGKFAGTKVSAAIAYANQSSNSSTKTDQVNGSISVLHDSGINATFSASTVDLKGTRAGHDQEHMYAKIGYIAKIFEAGTTAFSIDYATADDVAVEGDEFTAYSAAVVQNVKDIGADFFLAIKNHELDRTGLNTAATPVAFDFGNVLAIYAGARVKF